MKVRKKGNSTLPLSKASIILIVLFIVVIGFIVTKLFLANQTKNSYQEQVPIEDNSMMTYTDPAGAFTFKYPANFTVKENETYGVDGVVSKTEGTVSVQPPNQVFQLVIYKVVNKTPQEYNPCVFETQPFPLGRQSNGIDAIYKDTLCGPRGDTYYFTPVGRLADGTTRFYVLQVQTTGGFDAVQSDVEPIVMSFMPLGK